jgi:SM-20-related protein
MTADDAAARRVADALAGRGYDIVPSFVAPDTIAALREAAIGRHEAGAFRAARVGRAERATRAAGVRGDAILWLEPDDAEPAVGAALAALHALRATLNRELYLGLDALEAHFAVYPPGASYGVHVDRFRDDDARAVSVVLYLNDAWTAEDGGALRLYLERAGEPPYRDVIPGGGTLAVFLAERFAHEVLPARRARYSLTGWFRRRG